ncbi:MAG: exodeoxyribonuclease VII small subunit [Bacteroidota bacterium]
MKDQTFEEAQRRIQEILQSIDSGNVSLSEVELLLNEAQQLIDISLEQLTAVEQKLIQWDNSITEDNVDQS